MAQTWTRASDSPLMLSRAAERHFQSQAARTRDDGSYRFATRPKSGASAGTYCPGDRFPAFFRSVPNPYVLIDRDLRLVDMNDAYLRVTMREREELTGRDLFEAFPSDGGADALRASLERVLQLGTVDHLPLIRYDLARPEGGFEERYWSATHTPLLDQAGEVLLILQHTVDVTELHRLRRSARMWLSGPTAQIETDVLQRAEAVTQTNRALDAERLRLRALFDQAPGFMAVLAGPAHVYKLANAACISIWSARANCSAGLSAMLCPSLA